MREPVELRASTLDAVGASLPVPAYHRAGLTTGIVHIGVGAFHRAHQAAYLDDLLARGLARDFAICGLGVLDGDAAPLATLAGQDCLYVLALRHPDGHWDGRVIGSIARVVHAGTDHAQALALLAAPATRVVSLTITEGGYNTTPDGEFDLTAPAVRADLDGGSPPRTVFGIVTAALARRRDAGLAPFTMMSCDNIEGNGHVARTAFLSYARALDPDLADWWDERGAFPSSMVDRITPVTTDEVRREVVKRFGVADAAPVAAEAFAQWVLEDDFPLGRPEWELAGVQLVEDVRPFELMKLRLLNGSHQALALLGSLLGLTFVHEAAQDPGIAAFVRAYMATEAAATLPHVPETDLAAYQESLMQRFTNPEIEDTLARVASYTSDRMPKFVLPVLADQVAAGREVRLGAAVVAAWSVFCRGRDETGADLALTDHLAAELSAAANAAAADPAAFLELPVFTPELRTSPAFREAYAEAHRLLDHGGVRSVLAGLAT